MSVFEPLLLYGSIYFLEITGCIGSSVDSDQMESSSIDISRLGKPRVKDALIEVRFTFQNGYFLKVFEGHNSLVQAVTFSPNGQYLVSFLTLCMLGNFPCFCCCLQIFFKIYFLCPQRDFGRESHYPSVVSAGSHRVWCISPILFEVGISNLVWGCILGWWSVVYHF